MLGNRGKGSSNDGTLLTKPCVKVTKQVTKKFLGNHEGVYYALPKYFFLFCGGGSGGVGD